LLLSSTLVTQLTAQFHTPVLTGMEGQSLLDELVTQFKPVNIYNYGMARDTLFANIYSFNDSLSGVYSGYTIFLDPNLDPTTTAFQNGINTEHTYPRSLGAEDGNARSDMHHLYPTRENVNAERGNLPFGEVPDAQAAEWYYLGQSQTTIPSQDIDLYSERGVGLFEPREDHKGNVARAMFYFYTMYTSEANNADPNFFENQRETLCNWHYLDPVDSLEWERTFMIAKHQDDKPNPFVLDCSVASRSYCAGIAQLCRPINSVNVITGDSKNYFKTYPNPTTGTVFLDFVLRKKSDVKINFYNGFGSKVSGSTTFELEKGNHTIQQTLSNQGIHLAELEIQNQDGLKVLRKKVLVVIK